uniref:type I phosphomannose isomerase catalytic subunit n=1 Tax=Staphylococcus epidermidis TaxID=1282 RepID=UPI0028CB3033
HIGESSGISTHPHRKSLIQNPIFAPQTFDQLSNNHTQIFPHFPTKHFPLIPKILHPPPPFSIHLHPDDSYPYQHQERQYGKSESCYII